MQPPTFLTLTADVQREIVRKRKEILQPLALSCKQLRTVTTDMYLQEFGNLPISHKEIVSYINTKPQAFSLYNIDIYSIHVEDDKHNEKWLYSNNDTYNGAYIFNFKKDLNQNYTNISIELFFENCPDESVGIDISPKDLIVKYLGVEGLDIEIEIESMYPEKNFSKIKDIDPELFDHNHAWAAIFEIKYNDSIAATCFSNSIKSNHVNYDKLIIANKINIDDQLDPNWDTKYGNFKPKSIMTNPTLDLLSCYYIYKQRLGCMARDSQYAKKQVLAKLEYIYSKYNERKDIFYLLHIYNFFYSEALIHNILPLPEFKRFTDVMVFTNAEVMEDYHDYDHTECRAQFEHMNILIKLWYWVCKIIINMLP